MEPNPKLSTFLEEVYNGSIVLPDFQRSFIWEPEDIRQLLVSVLGGYFIGSMLILEGSKDEIPFALRLIEGVDKVNPEAKIASIVKVILDGQQRTTALFYALYEPNLPLRRRKNPYKFYLNLDRALKQDWDNAVIAVNLLDKRRLNEIKSNPNIIPFSEIKNIGRIATKFKNHPRFEEIIKIVNNFLTYELHVVTLPRNTNSERIVETFERVNRTGKPLSVFDLLTARLFKYGIRLRNLLREAKEKYTFAKYVSPETILKVIALLRGKELKRRTILELEAENFTQDWQKACSALEAAYNRVTDLKNGYGVLDFKKWMPYNTMIVPLAALLSYLKSAKLETKSNYDKIDRWYWASIFSNRYDQATDTISERDFNQMRKWIEEDKIPNFIKEFDPEAVDLDVDRQSSAIYRGVINLIVLKGALDFKTGQPPQFDREKVQDDHIFPKSIYKENRILNRTLISTNSSKGSKKPSQYFSELLKQHGKDKLIKILESHLIPAEALPDLLNDKLDTFMEKRKKAIIEEIRKRCSPPS